MVSIKILLVLPCNPGAKDGNYFPHSAWKQALNALKKYHIDKSIVDFAAIDSIITRLDPCKDKNTKGSIVLEFEMDRVKGYDLKPEWRWFVENDYQLLKEHSRCCKISFLQLLPLYDLIVVAVSVRGYKYAAIRALRDIAGDGIPEKVIVIDAGESPSFQNNAILIALNIIGIFIKNGKFSTGVIIKPEKLMEGIRFLNRPENLPREFIYWNQSFYQEIENLF